MFLCSCSKKYVERKYTQLRSRQKISQKSSICYNSLHQSSCKLVASSYRKIRDQIKKEQQQQQQPEKEETDQKNKVEEDQDHHRVAKQTNQSYPHYCFFHFCKNIFSTVGTFDNNNNNFYFLCLHSKIKNDSKIKKSVVYYHSKIESE